MGAIDWPAIIEAAETRGYFTAEDLKLTFSYATCAVGRITGGTMPPDPQMQKLGEMFISAIANDKFKEARRIVRKCAATGAAS